MKTSKYFLAFVLALALTALILSCSETTDSTLGRSAAGQEDDDLILPGDDAQADDAQADDTQADDTQADDTQTDDTLADDTQADDAQADDAQGDDAQSDDTQADDTQSDDAQTDDTAEPDCSAVPGFQIEINPIVEIGGLGQQEFWDFRTGYVQEYPFSLYPDPYLMNGTNQASIYGSIAWGVGWVYETQFFIENPYLLVSTVRPTTVNSLEIYYQPTVTYNERDCYFHEISGEAATNWNERIFSSNSSIPGTVQFWLVNALDAGFNYAAVPTDRCINVDPTVNNGNFVDRVTDITPLYYHYGHLNLNNLSPDDLQARVALLDRDVETLVSIKLWRSEPVSINQISDIFYQIHINPENGKVGN